MLHGPRGSETYDTLLPFPKGVRQRRDFLLLADRGEVVDHLRVSKEARVEFVVSESEEGTWETNMGENRGKQ